jgi:uncharacterized membrane protein YfcA
VSIWPGYVSGTATFRPELEGQGRRLREFGIASILGAVIGSILLLVLPSSVFRVIVPWLVLMSAALVAVQPRLARYLRRNHPEHHEHHTLWVHVLVLLSSVYGAYFGGGLGVILLGIFGLVVVDTFHRVNALKSAISLIVNTIALLAFVTFGPIAWTAVLVLAPASLIGGTVGVRLARITPPSTLRIAVVIIGTGVGIVLLVR